MPYELWLSQGIFRCGEVEGSRRIRTIFSHHAACSPFRAILLEPGYVGNQPTCQRRLLKLKAFRYAAFPGFSSLLFGLRSLTLRFGATLSGGFVGIILSLKTFLSSIS